MGGVLIILSVFFSSILWSDLLNSFVWIGLLTLISFGSIENLAPKLSNQFYIRQ